MSDYIQIEANTVYLGTLLEDMIDTVTRTKAMYCDVSIPDLFVEGYSHPLTYVPFYAMTLPLRKGDKVLIRFKDEDYSLPYIWKNPSEIDSAFYEKFEFPTGVDEGNIEIPESVETVSSIKIGENSFIIKTDNYTLIRQNDGYMLLDNNNNIFIHGSSVNIISNGDFNVDCSGDCKVYSSSKCEVVSKSDCNITTEGSCTIESKSDCNITTKGSCTIESTSNCNIKSNTALNITANAGVTVNNHLRVNP